MYFEYANALVLLLAGMGLTVVGLFLGSLIRPKRDTEEGLEAYECGEEPVGEAWFRFDIRFYTIALVYLVFAVEVAFLFPWARVLKEAVAEEGLGAAALLEGFLFTGVLVLGLAWVWAKGDLDWVRAWKPSPPGGRK